MGATADERVQANLATVSSLYEAFGRGDAEAILSTIADDCAWESWERNSAQQAGVSYLQPQRGPEGVAAFLAETAKLQIHELAVLDMFAGGDRVAVEILIDATAPGGGRYRDEELHLYTLDDHSKITRMRHYVDTAKHISASRGEDSFA